MVELYDRKRHLEDDMAKRYEGYEGVMSLMHKGRVGKTSMQG